MSSLRHHPLPLAAVSTLLVAAYLIASLGFLPSPATIASWLGNASTERFPCEGCSCGCASARECWTHCCCHTEHERIIWAIQSGVMPPAYTDFSDHQWLAAANAAGCPSSLGLDELKSDLRRGISPTTTIATANRTARRSCCSARRPTQPGPALSGLSCKGITPLLTFTLPPSNPARTSAFLLPPPRAEALVNSPCQTPPSRTLDAPVPPPRPTTA